MSLLVLCYLLLCIYLCFFVCLFFLTACFWRSKDAYIILVNIHYTVLLRLSPVNLVTDNLAEMS